MNETWTWNTIFSNLAKIRQKVKRTKVAQSFIRIILLQFFLRNSQVNVYPKNGSFWFFFQLIKNYAETTLLIDGKCISQEAFYTAH